MSRVAGLWAIKVIRSLCSAGSQFKRSCHSAVNSFKHSISPSLRASSGKVPPVATLEVAKSDQAVSFRRSSNGKSKIVANICVVSSIETDSTQLNSSPTGSASKIAPALPRISGSNLARFMGATTPVTAFRCKSCFGGSIEIKFGAWKSALRLPMLTPP